VIAIVGGEVPRTMLNAEMVCVNECERTARVIAIASGKGGAGKTNVSVNLAVALARLGRRTMLVDGDVGLANADILLGMEGKYSIADVAAKERDLARSPAAARRGDAGAGPIAGWAWAAGSARGTRRPGGRVSGLMRGTWTM
jgi:hypothetical protein